MVKSGQRKVGDRDYIVATPNHQHRHCLCIANVLKSCYEREPLQPGRETSEADGSPVLLSSTETVLQQFILVTGMSAVELSIAEVDSCLSVALMEGKLLNSVILVDLPSSIAYLTGTQCGDVITLRRNIGEQL